MYIRMYVHVHVHCAKICVHCTMSSVVTKYMYMHCVYIHTCVYMCIRTLSWVLVGPDKPAISGQWLFRAIPINLSGTYMEIYVYSTLA